MTVQRVTSRMEVPGGYSIVTADTHRLVCEITIPIDTRNLTGTLAAMCEAFARAQGYEYDNPYTGSDPFRRLGWRDEAQYRAFTAELARLTARWHGHPLEHAYREHVQRAKAAAGLPDAPGPYTFEQLAEIEAIVQRTPAIVDQDHDAEGTAA